MSDLVVTKLPSTVQATFCPVLMSTALLLMCLFPVSLAVQSPCGLGTQSSGLRLLNADMQVYAAMFSTRFFTF